jgi:beta-lactamase regulating signal transducer with metallopeptidase domain
MDWIFAQVNTIGGVFVELALPVLLGSAVTIGLILCVELALRKRVRAALRYWLVIFILVYLLSAPLLSLSPPSIRWPAVTAAYADPTTTTTPAARHSNALLLQSTTGQSQTTSTGAGERPRTLTWQGGVFLLWLAGMAVMSGVFIGRTVVARRRIAASPAANQLMRDILIYCRRRLGMKGRVGLRVSAQEVRPVTCGLLRPVIVVPRDLTPTLGSRHLRAVLFHELSHIKRGDAWVDLVQNVVQVIYFYNPLLWIANAVIRRLRDEAANEAVLEHVGGQETTYAERLADVARLPVRRRTSELSLIAVV